MEGFGGVKQSEGPKNRKRTISSQREQTGKSNTKGRTGATTKDLSVGSTDRREEAATQTIRKDGWEPFVERERHKHDEKTIPPEVQSSKAKEEEDPAAQKRLSLIHI